MRAVPRSGTGGAPSLPRRVKRSAPILLCLLACGGPTDVTVPVDRFLEAFNRHAATDAAAAFSEDAMVGSPSGSRLRGAEAIRGRFGWDSVVGARLDAEVVEVRGDTVVLALVERNEWQGMLGLDSLAYEPRTRVVVRGNRIAELEFAAPRARDDSLLQARLRDFLPWAQHEYSERLRRIRPGPDFDYQPRRAADWLSLLREWRTADQPRRDVPAVE